MKQKQNLKWSVGEAQRILKYGKELGRKEMNKKVHQENLHLLDLVANLQKELKPYRKNKLKEIEKINTPKKEILRLAEPFPNMKSAQKFLSMNHITDEEIQAIIVYWKEELDG